MDVGQLGQDFNTSASMSVTREKSRLFARMWAVAALAHAAGNGFRAGLLPETTLDGLALVLVIATAVLVLTTPTRRSLLLLCASILLSAFIEAPVLGNHWFIAGMVSLAFLLAGGRWIAFEPAARLILLVFYSMAAFTKLNEGFLDSSVSCAVFYANQALSSWALNPVPADSPAVAVLPHVVAGIELAIPFLLIVRRTRPFGVVLALGFHGVIALDLSQHFYDFSAVLAALFVLFLPPEWAQGVVNRFDRVAAPVRRGIGAAVVVLVLAVVSAEVLSIEALQPGILAVPHILWAVYLVALLALVARGPRTGTPLLWRPGGATWVAVALVAVNGWTPYTEVKTAFGYTMYSNLETVQGETNHLIVPATWPVRSGHDRLVAIESSPDARLAAYVDSGWLLPWPSFRQFMANNPTVAVTYRDRVERDGSGGTLVSSSTDAMPADLQGSSPAWWTWAPLRSVDSASPPRCQVGWLPAL